MRAASLSLALLVFAVAIATAQTTIVLGQSAALSGSAKFLGEEFRTGALAYFNYVNENNVLGDVKIRLITYDDGYEPERCLENTKRLIEQDKVDILFGYIGTPTTKRIMDLIEKTGIPFLFPFTGATFLRTPVKHNIFNIRASYEDETYNMVKYLIDQGRKKIAVFYQDDAYGHTGLSGVKRALEEYNLSPVAEGIYIRNTTAVRSAVVKIYLANPDAVILVGTSPACAKFIREYKNFAGTENTLFLNISFVGTKSLYRLLGEKYSKNVIFSEVVPFPWDDSIPVVAEYLALLSNYFPGHEPGWVSLEGFIAAKVTVEALKITLRETGGKFEREAFLNAMENLSVDIGGLKVSFSPGNHQAFKTTWLVKYEDGKYKQIGKTFFGQELAAEGGYTRN